ncbi:GNAT family N-acetyltransferase [Erythrobacter sp. THAF29]|uniref:GNAT family N-acetyltransferase n=1 Tax=Erythrobacter sp. THAF29 TaxID=2587851 RepID=UPI0015620E44|nr:GNAT family N-acetyltransferase [Erythrobacter sp. THAF29]
MATTIPLSSIPKESWDKIPASPRTPMRQYIWAKSYQETLAQGDVRAFLVGSASDPVALAPFAVPSSGPKRPVLLGAEDLWESIEVAAGDERALMELAQRIANCGTPLRFGHHPTDTRFLELLAEACRGKAHIVTVMQPTRAMPRIELDSSWAEPESHFNSRRRSDFRRMGRKAAKIGEVTFEIVEPRRDELRILLDEAFAVEAKGWKGRSGTAISQDEKTEAFYRDYARRAAHEGILRLCFMRIDGKAAAMQFAVECDRAFWLIKVGYDEAFKGVSPGNLLMRETIRYAALKGLKSYEFMGKEAGWTKLWAGDARPIATLRTYPYNLAGLSAFAGDGLAVLQKKLAERMKRRGADA